MPECTRQARVLIVDDEPDTACVVAQMLESCGYGVARANDGDEAFKVAALYRPDLVLLDVMMPGQDGWLVCAKMKSVTPSPKIVIFTVLKKGEADRLADFVHADDILHKPFTREQLLGSLDRVLAERAPPLMSHED